MKYIIALDQGTTSSRAILFDQNANIVSVSQNEFAQIYPRPGYVEHDPVELLYSQFRALADCFHKSGVPAGDVCGIGITNQRETVVVWDKETGVPVHNAIVWQCRRTAPDCEALKRAGHEPYIKEKTGLLIDAYFSGTKIKWILDNVPGARDKAEAGKLLAGTIDSWLIFHLTGGERHATDYTNASRTMLFDIKQRKWDDELLRMLDIPRNMLPDAYPSSHLFGHVKSDMLGIGELRGVPIAASAGDQHAALFGQACFDRGSAKCTYGTGCFLLMNTGQTPVESKDLLTTIAWGLGDEVEYALEGSVFHAGSVIKWLRDDLNLIQSARECDLLAD